jgi:hypothetical protein
MNAVQPMQAPVAGKKSLWWRRECLLALALLVANVYPLFWFPINNPNERVRVYMTAAMVEEGTFAIGFRESSPSGSGFRDVGPVYRKWGYVNDKALVCADTSRQEDSPNCEGKLYSAKAPGTSMLGAPFYLVAHWLGFQPDLDTLTLYLRFCVVLIPCLFFLYSLRRFLATLGVEDGPALALVGAVGVGSMIYTYSHMFAGHVLTAIFLFWAFAAVHLALRVHAQTTYRRPLLFFAAGFCAVGSVALEYPMVLTLPALALYFLKLRARPRDYLAAVAGALIPTLAVMWFHQEAFGAPWRTPYSWLENTQFVKDIDYGFMGLRAPRLENLAGSFLAPFNGMFFFAPWTALVVPAVVSFFAVRRQRDPLTGASLLVLGLLTLFISCHSLWRGGWTLGPRYIVPFVPFAALFLALEAPSFGASRLWRWLLAAGILASIAVTGASSLVSQGFHTSFYNPLTEVVLPLLAKGYSTPTLAHLLGLRGLVAMLPLLLAALLLLGFVLAPVLDAGSPNRLPRALKAAGVLGLTTLLCLGLLLPHNQPNNGDVKALAWTMDHFEPSASPKNAKPGPLLKALENQNWAPSGLGLLTVERLTRHGDWKGALRRYRAFVERRDQELEALTAWPILWTLTFFDSP